MVLASHAASHRRVDRGGCLGVGAEQRAALGKERLTRACLDQFARIYGADARLPRATLFKDWAADPLTATLADRAASGHISPGDIPWVSGAWQDRLALAGSETSPSDPGYLAGAVIAARRAVDQTFARAAPENYLPIDSTVAGLLAIGFAGME